MENLVQRGCETTPELLPHVGGRVEARHFPDRIADFLEAITNSQLFNERTFSYMKLGLCTGFLWEPLLTNTSVLFFSFFLFLRLFIYF